LCRFNTKALLRICPKCLGPAHGSAFCNGLMRCRKCLSSGLNSGNCPVQPRFSRPSSLRSSEPSSSGIPAAP
jgi:hypothetical protein